MLKFCISILPLALSCCTARAAGAPDALPSGPAGNWKLVFNDEFNGTELDAKTWNTGFWFTGSINKEQQFYRPENVRVTDGKLVITAEKAETATGWNGSAPNFPTKLPYTSGLIQTRGKFETTYGAFEARIKLPAGRGYFPAFWLKASPPAPGIPPNEIDILENLGHEPRAHMTYHYNLDGRYTRSPGNWKAENLFEDFHTYTVEWSPDCIRWFIDGVERRAAFTDARSINNTPMFLLINLAIGSGWSGLPDENTKFPQSLEVDYVRVWKRQTL